VAPFHYVKISHSILIPLELCEEDIYKNNDIICKAKLKDLDDNYDETHMQE
jgi:hypothetical protein